LIYANFIWTFKTTGFLIVAFSYFCLVLTNAFRLFVCFIMLVKVIATFVARITTCYYSLSFFTHFSLSDSYEYVALGFCHSIGAFNTKRMFCLLLFPRNSVADPSPGSTTLLLNILI
jgi:hypothetical protein